MRILPNHVRIFVYGAGLLIAIALACCAKGWR
jgi:hypothetical protein